MDISPRDKRDHYNHGLSTYETEELSMKHRLVMATLVAAINLLPLGLSAAEADRPKVGLVLGGGGARGAAHIGVLRELERMRIPVDAIAGTSMGAIVGGLYATGMSADEIESVVASMDWVDGLSDSSNREDLSFRRKQDDAQYPIKFELGYRDGELLLPRGVIQGQKLDLILRELTLDASHVRDFDKLPIPFRAIASDIGRGEPYVMGSGDLAMAIRASMSVPAAFAPVRLDGRLLVDGGIVGNLPVDVMRTMGVDIVIAVDVEFPLYREDELDSALTISEQMLTILIRKETLRQIDSLGQNDVLIRPDLGIYGSTNFGEILQTIEPGVLATREQSDKLSKLSLGEEEYAGYLAARSPRPSVDNTLSFVRVVHDGKLSEQVLESRLGSAAGDPVSADRLADDAGRLYGLQLYEKVNYRLVDEDGATGAEFEAKTKSWGPNLLQFGISLEDDLEGSTAFNVATRITRGGVNRLGGEWRTDVQLGTDPMLFSEFYQPLSFDSRFFVSPHVEFKRWSVNAFSGDDKIGTFRVGRAQASIDAGFEIGTVGEFRLGLFRGSGEARVKVGDPQIPNVDFDTGGTFARLRFDSLDDAHFPRKGFRADATWTGSRDSLGANGDLDTVEAELLGAWSRGKSTLTLGLGYATTLDSGSGIQDQFPLGGFLRMSGLERGQISGPHAGLARISYHRRVGDSAGGLFEVPMYIGVSAEAGNVWQSRAEVSLDTLDMNGSLFAGFDTQVGPVFFAAGFGEGGDTNFYLFIGSPPR